MKHWSMYSILAYIWLNVDGVLLHFHWNWKYSFVWFSLLVACGLLTPNKYKSNPTLHFIPSPMLVMSISLELNFRHGNRLHLCFTIRWQWNMAWTNVLIIQLLDKNAMRFGIDVGVDIHSIDVPIRLLCEWGDGNERERYKESRQDESKRWKKRVELSMVECASTLGYWINFNFIALQFNLNLFTVPLGALPNCHRLSTSFTTFIKWWETYWCVRRASDSDHVPKCPCSTDFVRCHCIATSLVAFFDCEL